VIKDTLAFYCDLLLRFFKLLCIRSLVYLLVYSSSNMHKHNKHNITPNR
jgi:hypothetical protein